ncbi:MAG: hypothetical protein DDT32_01847 [Syntrophomonadaceae bacterium]|nr:hypothetical protein [Bacillota bacterium]MBT9148077.1 hypothetical protein [Bacillota bacterium]
MKVLSEVLSSASMEGHILLRNWVFIVVILLFIAILAWGLYASYDMVMHAYEMGLTEGLQSLHYAAGLNNNLSLASVLSFLVAVIGASIVGSEFTLRTAKVRAANEGWMNVIMAKVLLILLISGFMALIASVFGIAGGRIIWSMVIRAAEIGRTIAPPEIPVSYWQQLLLVIMGMFFYGLLGGFIALVTRSSLAGAVAGIGIPFAERMFLYWWWLPSQLYAILIKNTFYFFEGGFVGPPPLVPPLEPGWLAWPALVGWTLLLGCSIWLLSRKQTT